jgi:hypothetical protein
MSQKIHNMVRPLTPADVDLEGPEGYKLDHVVPLPNQSGELVGVVLYVWVKDDEPKRGRPKQE